MMWLTVCMSHKGISIYQAIGPQTFMLMSNGLLLMVSGLGWKPDQIIASGRHAQWKVLSLLGACPFAR